MTRMPVYLRKWRGLGCVSGALIKEDYLKLIEEAGFEHIKIQKERKIELPDDLLSKYLDTEGMDKYKNEFAGIASITVYGEKPCCQDKSNCC